MSGTVLTRQMGTKARGIHSNPLNHSPRRLFYSNVNPFVVFREPSRGKLAYSSTWFLLFSLCHLAFDPLSTEILSLTLTSLTV